MAHVINMMEDIFMETALVEAKDFPLPKVMEEFRRFLEKNFIAIAFAEAGEFVSPAQG